MLIDASKRCYFNVDCSADINNKQHSELAMKPLHYLLFSSIFFIHHAAQAQQYDGTDTVGIEKIITTLNKQTQGKNSEQWRVDAQARINKYRKSDITFSIKDANGKPLDNAQVEIKLISHDFTFGGVIKANQFARQAEVLPHFVSQLGFNNALKYKHKNGLAKKAPAIIDWAQQHNISVRGHCLIYPGWIFMHKDAKKFQQGPYAQALKAFLENQLEEYARKWDIAEWDVMNEPLDNTEIPNLLGREVMAGWFKQAKEQVQNKNARLLINENRIISAPPENIDRIGQYKNVIQEVLADGGPIEAIGMQSRFRVDSITPEMVYQRLEQFNEFNLPIVATEFEIVNTPKYNFKPSALKRAQMTEEYMQVLFSHPNVDGIIAWTILNGLTSRSSMHAKPTNEKETKGILNWDMSLPLNGKVWLYLTKQHWTTNETKHTNEQGKLKLNAYHGTYQLTINHDGKITRRKVSLNKQHNNIAISL